MPAEYSKPSVTSNGCAYARLDRYNQNYYGRGANGAPVASQTRSNEVIVVPGYGGLGYNALQTQQQPSCSGYYSINGAYPSYPNTCGQFSSNLCG
jgi:hypothetical protein